MILSTCLTLLLIASRAHVMVLGQCGGDDDGVRSLPNDYSLAVMHYMHLYITELGMVRR